MSENDKYTREGDKRFTLRIEKGLFKRIEDSARAHKRSIGREIEYLLELQLNIQLAQEDGTLAEYMNYVKNNE